VTDATARRPHRRWVGAALAAVVVAGLGWPVGGMPADAQGCEIVPPPAEASSFAIDTDRLVLGAGESAAVGATLAVGARPQVVDVYFVIDSSESMRDLVGALQSSVVAASERLAAGYIDLHLGVARFSDIVLHSYEVVRPLTPADCRLPSQLEGFITSDVPQQWEPHHWALYQAVTGAGGRIGRDEVPSGLQAAFRNGTRLVVHSSDAPAEPGVPTPPGNDEVGREFRRRGVTYAALQVLDSANSVLSNQGDHRDPAATRADMEAIARATGSAAPPGGVDCNGDGLVGPGEPGSGAPVVCAYDYTLARLGVPQANPGEILEALVAALRKPSPVEIVALADGGLEVAMTGNGADMDTTKPGQSFSTSVGLTCPPTATGSQHEVVLAGVVAGATVATRTVAVTCGQPVAAPPAPPPPPAPAPPAEPPVAPPAQPPAPAPPAPQIVPGQAPLTVAVPNAATASATSSAPAQVAQLAPGVGIVPDEVAQHSFATETAERDRPLLASRRRPAPSPVVTWVAGAMLLAAMSVAAERRRQHATAPARTERSRHR
jgi:hypothetical protein